MAIMMQIFVIQSSLDMIRNYIFHPFDCRFKISYMQKSTFTYLRDVAFIGIFYQALCVVCSMVHVSNGHTVVM